VLVVQLVRRLEVLVDMRLSATVPDLGRTHGSADVDLSARLIQRSNFPISSLVDGGTLAGQT
jgi:hypothetical protein